MLKEQENKNLVNHEEYNNIFNYYHDEYTQMLKKFLERHEVKIKEDDCLIDYIVKTRFFMPKYSVYTIPITNAMYNEDVPEEMKYTLMVNSFGRVRSAFSE